MKRMNRAAGDSFELIPFILSFYADEEQSCGIWRSRLREMYYNK